MFFIYLSEIFEIVKAAVLEIITLSLINKLKFFPYKTVAQDNVKICQLVRNTETEWRQKNVVIYDMLQTGEVLFSKARL